MGKQDAGSDGPVILGNKIGRMIQIEQVNFLHFRFAFLLFSGFRSRSSRVFIFIGIVAVSFLPVQSLSRQVGNNSQRGQSTQLLHILRSLDCIVQVFQHKTQADASKKADEQGQNQVHFLFGRNRVFRDFGRINDGDVAGLQPPQSCRYLGLALALLQRIQCVSQVFHLNFQAVIKNGIIVCPPHFHFLSGQSFPDGFLILHGLAVFQARGFNGLPQFFLEIIS